MEENSSPSFSLSSPEEFEKWRERHTFEHCFKKYFPLRLPDDPRKEIIADEDEHFRLNDIFHFTSNWIIETEEDGDITIKRNLVFHPPSDIKKWRIRLRISDWITSHAEGSDANAKTFELVANTENKKCTFEYSLKETDLGTLVPKIATPMAACMDITVLENKGLETLIRKSVDFTKEFERSNVILDFGGIKLHFPFEILAVQSQFFYDQWSEFKEKEYIDIPTIKLDGIDPSEALLVLKMLYYRKCFVTTQNMQIILGIADKLKFEMILKYCEESLMTFTEDEIDTATRLQLAYRYDLNGQLDWLQWLLRQQCNDSTVSSYFSNEKSRCFGRPEPLHDITAKKFEFPESITKSSKSGAVMVKPRDSRTYYDKKMSCLISWAYGFYYRPSRGFLFSVRPSFSGKYTSMKVSNWMVVADFKLKMEGHEHIVLRETFTTGNPSVNRLITKYLSFPNDEPLLIPFTLEIDVKSIKGLRYYVKHHLRDFYVKHPSSDIILEVNEHKLFANLNILAHNSEYFAGIKRQLHLFPVDEEHGLPKVEYKEDSTSAMRRLLMNMYGWSGDFSDDDTVEKILPLVDRFLCTEMKMSIQDYLVCERFPMGVRTLQIAFDHDLFYVKEEYLMNFQYASEIHALSSDPDFKHLSNEAKVALFDRLSELPLIEETNRSSRSNSPDIPPFSPRSPLYSPESSF